LIKIRTTSFPPICSQTKRQILLEVKPRPYIHIQQETRCRFFLETRESDMEEEEHEVYGGEIPDEVEMEGDMDSHHADVDMSAADDVAVKVSPFQPFFCFPIFCCLVLDFIENP
jgi:hypothetical protein